MNAPIAEEEGLNGSDDDDDADMNENGEKPRYVAKEENQKRPNVELKFVPQALPRRLFDGGHGMICAIMTISLRTTG